MSRNESGNFFAMQPFINYLSSDNEEIMGIADNNFEEYVYEPTFEAGSSSQDYMPNDYAEVNEQLNSSDEGKMLLNLNYNDNIVIQETPVKTYEENLSVNHDMILSVQKRIHLYPDGSLRDDLNSSTKPSQIALKTLKSIPNETPVKNDQISIPDFLSPILHVKPTTPVVCTPKKTNLSNCELSPELFSDEDIGGNINNISDILSKSNEEHSSLVKSFEEFKKDQFYPDRQVLRKFQESMKGIPPPPSIANCQMSVDDILEKITQNQHLMNECYQGSNKDNQKSIYNSTREEIDSTLWPEIKNKYFYGLQYNRSRISENIEQLSQKYIERYIGAETSSTCLIWALREPSSGSKRKMLRKQVQCKSPGRRLSHLARRRIAFSKENLSSKTSVLSTLTTSSSRRQIFLDLRRVNSFDATKKRYMSPRKRSPRKSPRKRTPRKTPTRPSPRKKIRTPGSGRKRPNRDSKIVEEDLIEPIYPSTSSLNLIDRPSSSKRALFQSPSNKSSLQYNTNTSLSMLNSRRALFTSPINKKRKRSDTIDSETDILPGGKVARSFSTNDVHAGKSAVPVAVRRHSEMSSSSTDFSAAHKKKMLWAVSEALRSQEITMRHPEFKIYAASLVRICKALMPDLMGGSRISRMPGSTSERMLKITRQYVYNVIKGQSVDSIIKEALLKSDSATQTKPKGYIAPDDFINRENMSAIQEEREETSDRNVAASRSVLKENLINSVDCKTKYKRQITFD